MFELRLPDGKALQHGDSTYDPVKAREYYLKTRQLKGRKKGTTEVPPTPRSSASPSQENASTSVTVKLGGKTYKMTAQQHAEQKAYADHRVAQIKTKLHKLQSSLKEKMAKAKRAEREAKKPDSAAEKDKKAKDAEKYRDKHKQELKTKAKKAASKAPAKKPNLDTVAGLKTAIKSAQVTLSKAVERQRALSTASKG